MIDFAASRRLVPLVLSLFVALATIASASKVETWRQDSPAAFAKGKKERVVVSDTGRIRLGRMVEPVGALDAAHVWDLARAKSGAVYAATGSSGKIYRKTGDDPWTMVHDSDDSQALSLVAMPDGRVFAGTGPSGKIVELTDPKTPTSQIDAAVKYIWDLATDPAGNLYAATGPTGQLWKRDVAGKWSILLDSKHSHLLCVAVGPDGSVFAGSDGEGLIYKVTPDGKTSVLYDAPQNEVRCLLVGPDGGLYAGTAAESVGGSGGGSGRGFGSPMAMEGAVAPGSGAILTAQVPGVRPGDAPAPPGVGNPPGGTATPRPGPPGENAVYRIGTDGAPREIFRAKALIYALALSEDRLLVGTGPEGIIYEVRDLGRESAPIARLDHGQVLAMLGSEKGDVLVGTGDPGAVLKLTSGYVESGSILSDIHDTKLVSKFGAVSWKAEVAEKTSVAVQVRTGNVGEPDGTWSNWSPLLTDPASAKASVPLGRFVQYRAFLKTADPASTPELRSISLLYQTANLPPEIARIVVPDPAAGEGAQRAPRLAVRWDANDPNDDEMTFSLALRKDGWPDWVKLTETPLTEKAFAWDVTAIPAGHYRLRVTATDRPSNPPETALTRELTSDPFIIDHLGPSIGVATAGPGVKVTLKDDFTRIVKAAYALDGGEWVAIFPDDGLFDTRDETISIAFKDLKPGTHVVTVRATDAAGNLGTGDAVFKAP
ncbi:MAG: hypothetical protein JWN86_1627 [Planctomycetota bacterium]|nr:hypothetical protein [Planctomycetota bacterium]